MSAQDHNQAQEETKCLCELFNWKWGEKESCCENMDCSGMQIGQISGSWEKERETGNLRMLLKINPLRQGCPVIAFFPSTYLASAVKGFN